MGSHPFIGGLVRGSFPAPHHHDPNKTLPNFQIWVMVAAPSCQHKSDGFSSAEPCPQWLTSRCSGSSLCQSCPRSTFSFPQRVTSTSSVFAPSCTRCGAQCSYSGTSNFVPMSSARKWRNCTLYALRPWYKGDLVAHLAVLPNNHEDKAVFRDVFEHLGRSLSPEKHLRHWCWPLRPARVRTLKTKPSISWWRLTSSSTPQHIRLTSQTGCVLEDRLP